MAKQTKKAAETEGTSELKLGDTRPDADTAAPQSEISNLKSETDPDPQLAVTDEDRAAKVPNERTGLWPFQQCPLRLKDDRPCGSWNTSSRSSPTAVNEETGEMRTTHYRYCHDCGRRYKVVTVIPGPPRGKQGSKGSGQ